MNPDSKPPHMATETSSTWGLLPVDLLELMLCCSQAQLEARDVAAAAW